MPIETHKIMQVEPDPLQANSYSDICDDDASATDKGISSINEVRELGLVYKCIDGCCCDACESSRKSLTILVLRLRAELQLVGGWLNLDLASMGLNESKSYYQQLMLNYTRLL